MKIDRSFDGFGDRYQFDFRLCSYANGYCQVDTSQDAWYFGTWANPTEFKIVSYTEGDITVTTCENEAEFIGQMEEMRDWNIKSGYSFAVGSGLGEEMAAIWSDLGLDAMLH